MSVRTRNALAAAVAALGLAVGAAPAAGAGARTAGAVSDRVVVVFEPGVPAVERARVRSEAGTTVVRSLGRTRFQLLEPAAGQTVGEAVAELRRTPGVAAADPNASFWASSVPNDPLFGQLWGLLNTGQPLPEQTSVVSGADIDATLAWDRTVGVPSTVVADIDAGYRFDHPDLAPVAWTNPGEIPADGIDNDANGFVDDWRGWDTFEHDNDPTDRTELPFNVGDYSFNGHGVHTAGTIGAKGNNGVGVTGVAQDVRIMPVRALKGNPSPFGTIAMLVEAINYAGRNGARAANMSLSAPGRFPTLSEALAANPQTLFVSAAGNDASDNDIAPKAQCEDPTAAYVGYTPPPGAIDNVVCVAATDPADRLASFSNFGSHSVDLGAPGVATLSTRLEQLVSGGQVGEHQKVWTEDFQADGFDAWTTPVPPADDASLGFALAAGGPINLFVSTQPLTHTPGTTRATQTPPISVPASYDSCTIDYDRLTEASGDDRFSWAVFVDGTKVLERTEGATTFDHPTQEFLLPASQTPHTVTARFWFYRGLAGADPANASLDTLALRCVRGNYEYDSGTSMATPHVTGTAALLFSLKPSATVTQVKQALLAGVDPLKSLKGKTVTGGRLNAWKALAALVPMDTRIVSGPTGSVNSTTATFTFDTNNTGNAGFECRLDSAQFAACDTPQLYGGLKAGKHSFRVRSAVTGGVDTTPPSRDWTIQK